MSEIVKELINSEYVSKIEQYVGENQTPPESAFTLAKAFPLQTPTNNSIPYFLDCDNRFSIESLLRVIFSNLLRGQQELLADDWFIVFSLLSDFASVGTSVTKMTKLSLAVAASRFQLALFWTVFPLIGRIVARVTYGNWHPLVEALFQCENSIGVLLKNTNLSHYSAPSIIVVDEVHDSLRGWICFNNCIAVNGRIFDRCTVPFPSSVHILDLFTLILHEAKHGILRMDMNNFNVHTPDLLLAENPLESGYLTEKKIWNGVIPRWFNPKSFSDAEIIANKIIEGFHKSQNLVIDDSMKQRIIKKIGNRLPINPEGSVDISRFIIYE
jgi:hypothetical protein